jgi:hypothetical protein
VSRPRAALGILGAALLAAGCREHGRPDPNIRMAVSHQRAQDAAPAGDASDGAPAAGQPSEMPTRLEVPPAVAQAYSGIRIGWKDKTSGKEGVLQVPLGEAAPLPDPTLVVRADVFLPAFSMSAGAITSEGVEPQNPAARITVFEKGKEVFAGWIFTRFPDVHPFVHPRFQLKLDGGVPRASK